MSGAGFPDGQGKALGYGQYSIAGTATILTTSLGANSVAIPKGTTRAQISVSAQAVRYRDDGTAPTASVGYPKPTGSEFTYAGNFQNLQFIAQTGTATLDVLFYQ